MRLTAEKSPICGVSASRLMSAVPVWAKTFNNPRGLGQRGTKLLAHLPRMAILIWSSIGIKMIFSEREAYQTEFNVSL